MAYLTAEARAKLDVFKAVTVKHARLREVDEKLSLIVEEHADATHVLLYGSGGVGKSKVLEVVAERFNGTDRTSLQGSTNAEGTPYYMAPEQFLGKSVRASDQYALATVVYEWLSGTVPFSEGDRIEPGSQHLHEPVPSLRTLVPTLSTSVEQQAVMKALARQPEDRFPSIEAFVEALLTTDVFISYAQRDQNLCDQLENHLSHLKYRGLITTWTAREISAGEEIIQQTDMHLNTAHLILLLISANFLASKSCYSRDMMQAIQCYERGEAHVVPVLLRPVVFTGAPFARLKPLPTNRKPVVTWRNRDSAFVDIAVGIERVVQERLAPASRVAPSLSRTFVAPSLLQPTVAPLPPSYYQAPAAPPAMMPQQGLPTISRSSVSRRGGLILVGLSLLGLLCAGGLLVQHPNLIPFIGVIVGSLILSTGILLAIRALGLVRSVLESPIMKPPDLLPDEKGVRRNLERSRQC